VSGNRLKFREAVRFSLTDQALVKVQDDYAGAFKPPAEGAQHESGLGTTDQQQLQSGLLVRIAATHAGIITRNNGFYLPDKMKKGANTFTQNYKKPVLLHHQDGNDPVGRIVDAQYMDTSGAIQDAYNLAEGLRVIDRMGKEKGIITDVLLKDFIGGKMPFGMQVDTICSLLRDSLLEDEGYQGLGYISIVAQIANRDAIEKLLDGRYLTGSVGATTDKAVCSICRQDWTDAGKCEHKPGAIYDGAKCFIIAGNLDYDEYSFVNVPADRHSKVLELHYNGIQDSIEIAEEYSGRIYEVRLGFPQYDSAAKEDEGMADKEKDPKDQEATIKDEVITDSDTPESAEQKTEENADVQPDVEITDSASADETGDVEDASSEGDDVSSSVDEEVEDASNKKKKKGKTMKSKCNADTEEGSLEDAVTAFMDAEELTDEDLDKFYDEVFWPEVEAAFEDEEFTLAQAGITKLEEAKLSSEKRKKLAKSTFCGPDRSFPVPDCAHVTAARRLIGRYKGGGDKSKILACVSRKAKAMGCGSSSKKKDAVEKPVGAEQQQDSLEHGRVMHMVIAALEEAQHFSKEAVLDESEVKMLQGILKRLAAMVGKDSFLNAAVAEELASNPECEQALADEVEKLEDTVGDLRDQLDALRKEYSSLFSDMETLQDALTEATAANRASKEEKLSMLRTLRDGKTEEETSFTEMSDSDLQAEIDTVLKQVDMTKIVDKLGDGMAREPQGTVEDPNAIQDDDGNQKSPTSNLATGDELVKIQEHVQQLMFTPGGREKAGAYVRRLQAEGKLPLDSETN